VWLQRQRGINRITKRPYAIRDAKHDRWRSPLGLVNAAKGVVGHVQADGGGVMGELL